MKQSNALKVLILCFSGLSLALGILVLIGWHTGNVDLIQVLPMFVPMQYNTALGFLLSSIGLLAIFKEKVILGKVIFIAVGIIGLLTLLEYLIGTDFGIDQLIMVHYVTVETSHPGRMAPNTALCFLLTSIAMLLSLNTDMGKVQVSGVLGFLIFGLGLVAFLGYIINVEVTYGWGKLTKMAVHTALGFMLIGTGVTSLNINKELNHSLKKNINSDTWIAGYAFSAALIIFFIDLSMPCHLV